MNRAGLLGKKIKCTCGQQHQVPVEKVVIKGKAIELLPKLLKDLKNPKKLLIVSDKNTHQILGEKLAKILRKNNFLVQELVMQQDQVVADDETASWVSRQVENPDILVACGSGTITDLTKYAAWEHKKPFVAVATAASMNGYASNIVALTCKGLKRTIKVNPALAVIADLDIICAAPFAMTCAGLGDVISKPVANADWKLASLIKKEHFCSLPFELIKDLEDIYFNQIKLLKQTDPKIMAALMEALIYSGISMVIAGSSAPASGGEHLISHTLDIQANLQGKQHDFHGAQVGVATIFTSLLYEKMLNFKVKQIQTEQIIQKQKNKKNQTEQEVALRKYWLDLYPEIAAEYAKKQMSWEKKQEELKFIQENWAEIVHQIQPFLLSAAKIKRLLTDGGAKTHYTKLGLKKQEFKQAVLMAPFMRARYTILDLAQDFGLLEKFTNQIIGEDNHD
ncbi:MAG: iron-containing alcohol dehydrogenase [Pseudomonadota bacterium]